ncbi:hypothetical protein BGZ76_007557 [Entomortierella beljakovae]|nr:hypothetical protein BGZ76_007557 [Entomortierella beljakovae]
MSRPRHAKKLKRENNPFYSIELRQLFPFTEQWLKASFSNQHLEFLGQALRRALRQRDYVRALKLYSVMTTTLHINEELVWKIGCEFLMQKQEYEPQCLRFLQLILAKSKRCKESIIIETALYQLRSGKPEDAHTTLEPYINIYPYNEDPQLLAYAGVVDFALWNKSLREKVLDEHQSRIAGAQANENGKKKQVEEAEIEHEDWLENEDDPDPNVRQIISRINRHGNSAARLLELGLQMNPKNDMFLKYIAALENRTVQQTLELILNQDPAADSELYVMPLMRLLLHNLPPGQSATISNIVNNRFMGYPGTPRDTDHKAMPNWIREQADLRRIELTIHTAPYCTDDLGRFRDLRPHQPDVKYVRPILKLLLTRAEFGVMSEAEEQQLEAICSAFCFCSVYCR